MNTEVKETLYVFTLDEVDTFGCYEEDELMQAMKDLFVSIKEEVDKHYSVEEQLEFHFPLLSRLHYLMVVCKHKDIRLKDIKEFLEIYNELAPNEYDISTVEVNPSDFAIVIRYINSYGLQNYKNNFNKIVIEQVEDELNKNKTTLTENDLYNYLEYTITYEVVRIQEEYTPREVLKNKYHYLQKLATRYKELKNGKLPLILLDDFINDFNNEYKGSVRKMRVLKKDDISN
ncbi:hypothetical protein [Staphylococcus simulans]